MSVDLFEGVNTLNQENVFKTIVQKEITRPGIANLWLWLSSTDFMKAPASTRFHLAEEGGLLWHSLHVYDLLAEKNARYGNLYSPETIAVCGLFHDLCKVNYYVKDTDAPSNAQMNYLATLESRAGQRKTPRLGEMNKEYASRLIQYYKEGGEVPEYTDGGWKVDDQLPIGHGEKSVILLQKFIDLTDDEVMAIRWHMVAFDAGIHFDYPSGFPFRQATAKCKLVTLLFTADFEASNILEGEA